MENNGATERMSKVSHHRDGAREEVRAHFDRWAEGYDRAHITRYIRKMQKRIVTQMAPREDAFVLDVGCGTGEGIRYLGRRVKKGLLAGLDISPQMIELARRKFSHHPGIEWRVGDAETLPWPDAFFDEVMSTFTLHHVPHPDGALAEIARVLKPRGRLFLADLLFPHALRRPLNWIWRMAEGTPLEVQTSVSLRQILLRSSILPASSHRLAPFIFLFIGQKNTS